MNASSTGSNLNTHSSGHFTLNSACGLWIVLIQKRTHYCLGDQIFIGGWTWSTRGHIPETKLVHPQPVLCRCPVLAAMEKKRRPHSTFSGEYCVDMQTRYSILGAYLNTSRNLKSCISWNHLLFYSLQDLLEGWGSLGIKIWASKSLHH